MRLLVVTALAALCLSSCVTPGHGGTRGPPGDPAPVPAPANPLLRPWAGPYGGVPAFDQVKVEHFQPALEAAMEQARREAATIAESVEPPAFENTIARMEGVGRTFRGVMAYYGVYSANLATPDFRAVEREMAPRLAAFADEIAQNEKLFRRVEAVHAASETSGLTAEQRRLVWRRYTQLVRSGARLDAAGKRRMTEINQRLAALYTTFSQNVLGDEESHLVLLDREEELAGLPESVRSSARAAAAAANHPGGWAITNTRSSVDPFLTYASRRDLREKVWRSFVSRGDNGDERDTKGLIPEILSLRRERARLLGYPTHAHLRLENAMARTPEQAMALMESVWPSAVARVREEVAAMAEIARKEGQAEPIAPWDYRYYAEKVRKATYDLDQAEVKPYLQLEKLREGMFWVAGELFGFDFAPVEGIPVYHPDVRVWQVKERGTGRHVGLWYFDPYARPGKRSGAWMNAYRNQERFEGEVPPIVSNNANFVKSGPGEPTLVSWDDAETLFHEFGHALHGLSSRVSYPTLSGTIVPRDYVEFPSQLLERWLATPEVLNRFALHHATGKPLPPELLERIERASTFNQGFATVEYLASALLDMKLHLAEGKVDAAAFERKALAALGMPREMVMRHRLPHFLHVFGGDGYSAGYYSYLWSDTLSADAFEAFREGQGPYDRAVAARLREHVFQVGDTVDPAEGYRAFRGRDPDISALMRHRGFVPAASHR